MSYRNIYYNSRAKKMTLFTWDKDGNPIREEYDYKPWLYVGTTGSKDAVSMFNTPLKKITFNTDFERRKYVADSGITKFFDNLPCIQQFLVEKFWNVNETPEFSQIPLKVAFIDIEVYSPGEFPEPREAKAPINAITLYDTYTKIYNIWGTKPYTVKQSDMVYHYFADEKEMMKDFIQFFELADIDVFSGFNCVREDQSVWLQDRIKQIKDIVKQNDVLYQNKKIVDHVNTCIKQQYKITTEFGNYVYCSDNHRFPVYIKTKKQYKNANTLLKNKQDIELKDINLSTNDYFVEIPIRQNTNKHTVMHGEQQVYQLLGYIYTDGTYNSDDRKEYRYYRFTTKYESVCKDYIQIINEGLGRELGDPYKTRYTGQLKGRHGKVYDVDVDMYHKQFHENDEFVERWKSLIYNKDNKKELNLELLSTLSYDEFIYFIAGCVDGDGWIEPYGISICNYEKNDNAIQKLQELCLWNGIITTRHDNYITIISVEQNRKHIEAILSKIKHPYRKEKGKSIRYYTKKNTVSKLIKWFIYDDKVVVGIKSIEKTDEKVNMYDIHTEDHYFICNGMKVHNCESFDIPYIMNRINNILDSDWAKRMSPVGEVYSSDYVNRFGALTQKWKIQGISCIDYLEIYRKLIAKELPSFKLNYIAELELGEHKLEYEQSNLFDLADKDWERFIDYNIQDVVLLVKLDQKLKYLHILRLLAYAGLTDMESAMGTTAVTLGGMAIRCKYRDKKLMTFKREGKSTYAGAFVIPPVKGFHSAIASFDANSLYPNTCITCNISPETKLGYIISDDNSDIVEFQNVSGKLYKIDKDKFYKLCKQEKMAVAANKIVYNQKIKGVLPEYMDYYYQARVKVKKVIKDLKKKYEEEQDPQKKHDLKFELDRLDMVQYSYKIQINSAYGALGAAFFPAGDTDVAASITATGKATVKKSYEIAKQFAIEQGVSPEKAASIVVGGDTDSVVGGTIINVNDKPITIADYYNSIASNYIKYDDINKNYIKRVDNGDVALAYNNGIVQNKIKHVMKHTVKKRMYKIKCNGKEVIMTEDHSIIVNRNGKNMSISPKDILKTDTLIIQNNEVLNAR